MNKIHEIIIRATLKQWPFFLDKRDDQTLCSTGNFVLQSNLTKEFFELINKNLNFCVDRGGVHKL